MQLEFINQASEIIKSIQEGDKDGFNRLVGTYHKDLSAGVWHMSAGSLSREDVEDVIQETWAEVYQRIIIPQGKSQFDPERASFKTYMLNIAKYRILSRMSRMKFQHIKRQQEDSENILGIIENLPDSEQYIPEKQVMEKEEKKLRLSAFMQTIRLVFLCGGYPHQQLAFVFSKLLHGKQSERSLEGKAEVIYSEMGMVPFSSVVTTAKEQIQERLDSASVRDTLSCLVPLEKRLPLKLECLMANDWPSKNYFQSILEKTAKDTSFKDYYSVSGKQDDEKNTVKVSNTVSNWVYKLEQNIKKQLGISGESEKSKGNSVDVEYEGFGNAISELEDRGSSCRKCRFREVPPCNEKIG